MTITGGYLVHRRPAISARQNGHTTRLERPISELDLGALNAVQNTPWTINRWILDVMREAWSKGLRLGGLEVMEPLSIPDRLPDDVWAGLTQEDRTAHSNRLRLIYSENATIMGRSRAVLDSLSVAEELRDKPAIWFPHSKDFRHRIYPSATFGPNPQGSDIQKALLMFAEGLPLGPDGLFWLCVRAANTFGMDKLSLEDRVAWTLGHELEIKASTTLPLTTTSWWTGAAEPWSFLATCHELTQALSESVPDNFISHLPIPMDGSCNGLQHLAAMGLDPIGAQATNLTPGTRQDVYEAVATKVRLQVEQDIFDGIDEARVWHGRVSRDVVKRAVMTTPYGVTDRGIREQLLNDGFVPDDAEVGRGDAAEYLKDRLVRALGDTVQSARSIMAWLQSSADRLARAGLPLDWTTPSGSKVRQAYHTTIRREIRTLVGSAILYQEEPKGGLNARKQALGAAPNVIHSFDAAHLSLTVDEAARQGITAFAMIHDSYGTHAANTTRLSTILRQKFVDIYRTDWLQELKREINQYAPYVQIDDPPPRGDFDIRQVLDAPYFFS